MWALLLACARPPQVSAPPVPQVRYRPSQPAGQDGQLLLAAVPGATWDAGLAGAAQDLVSMSTSRRSAIDPRAVSSVLALQGYPGQARFLRLLNGGAFPASLADQVALAAADEPAVDVALARRSYGDGTALWVLGWAPRRADLDPLPRDLRLDDTLPLRVSLDAGAQGHLFVAPPDGPVEELSIASDVTRWVDRFHTPGSYRIELLTQRSSVTEVALLFSVFVDVAPPVLHSLAPRSTAPVDPISAESVLYDALNAVRAAHGLPPVQRFSLFEPLAREHSALMAAHGTLAHSLPGLISSVPERAAAMAHPRAVHHEDVAVASTVDEAIFLVQDSPAHLASLLCERCTHAVIGAALEPVLDRPPRLFVTWELLEFPQGAPRRVDHYNR